MMTPLADISSHFKLKLISY